MATFWWWTPIQLIAREIPSRIENARMVNRQRATVQPVRSMPIEWRRDVYTLAPNYCYWNK